MPVYRWLNAATVCSWLELNSELGKQCIFFYIANICPWSADKSHTGFQNLQILPFVPVTFIHA